MEMKKQVVNISERFKLIKAVNRDPWPWSGNPSRILVLLMPWMNAQDKHVSKYINIYSDLGLDILCMTCRPIDLLWPPQSMKEGKNLIKILQTQCKDYDSILVHSLSVGAYNFNNFHIALREDASKNIVEKKICGVIYDSVAIGGGKGGLVTDSGDGKADNSVDALDLMVRGVIKSISDNKAAVLVMNLCSKIYFAVTKSQTVDFYAKTYDELKNKPFKVPSLFFASKNDEINDYKVLLQLAEFWRVNFSMPIRVQIWDKSAHTQHLVLHKGEYLDVHNQFLTGLFVKSKL